MGGINVLEVGRTGVEDPAAVRLGIGGRLSLWVVVPAMVNPNPFADLPTVTDAECFRRLKNPPFAWAAGGRANGESWSSGPIGVGVNDGGKSRDRPCRELRPSTLGDGSAEADGEDDPVNDDEDAVTGTCLGLSGSSTNIWATVGGVGLEASAFSAASANMVLPTSVASFAALVINPRALISMFAA